MNVTKEIKKQKAIELMQQLEIYKPYTTVFIVISSIPSFGRE